jgi:hypothetical protein
MRSCCDCFGFCLLSFLCLECCLAAPNRKKTRDLFGLRKEGCCGSGDCCTHCCCTRCSLCQETRELNVSAAGQHCGGSGHKTWRVFLAELRLHMHQCHVWCCDRLASTCPQMRLTAGGVGQQGVHVVGTTMAGVPVPPPQQFMVYK